MNDLFSRDRRFKRAMTPREYGETLTARDRKLLSWNADAASDDGMPYDQWERLRGEQSLVMVRLLGRELPECVK